MTLYIPAVLRVWLNWEISMHEDRHVRGVFCAYGTAEEACANSPPGCQIIAILDPDDEEETK